MSRCASASGKVSRWIEPRNGGGVPMMDQLLLASTVLAALGSGLIAGNFFAFSAYMMTALDRLPVPQGISAMQSITAALLSPVFLVAFLRTAALPPIFGI